jgi:hypothetical protein
MDFFDEINKLKYFYLTNVIEPIDNQLFITIKAATVFSQEEDLFIGGKNLGPVRRITSDGSGVEYEFFFKSYGAYCVTNESFATLNKNEERIGRLFCIYSKSNYLDYIRDTTLVNYTYDYDNTLKHYAINCQNHVIDIITIDEPVIKRVS